MGFQNTWKISLKILNCVICFVIALNYNSNDDKSFKPVLSHVLTPRQQQHPPQKREREKIINI